MAYDKTREQVRQQLQAFNVPLYEIQPIPPKGDDTLKRERIRKMTAVQAEASLGWAKAMNSQGYDVYIRPSAPDDATTHPLVFVDDISLAVVERMSADGLPFAVLIESSTARYHGWIRIAGEPLGKAEASAAGRVLAQRYGADPASADWRHYGRLAGFTNRKPSRATAKGQPFVLLRGTSTGIAPGGTEVLDAARQMLIWEAREARRASQAAMSRIAASTAGLDRKDALSAFSEAWQAAKPTRGEDRSARDFSAVLALLRRGYSEPEVGDALRLGSPGLGVDRQLNVDAYVQRTIKNAVSRIEPTIR